ncbi:MAG: ornithine cyclodeaminase family protein [Longimicrobiales bacterium]
MRILSRAEVVSLVSMESAIDAMASAFGQLSAGNAEMPIRGRLTTGPGVTLFMPARLATDQYRGAKVVSLYQNNRSKNLPSIHGVILMIDDETGQPVALMDAGELTAIRTAAATGLAAKLLSRPESSVLTIFGAGGQAPRQIEAVRTVRPITEVRVVSRNGESAARLAASLEGVDARAVSDPAIAIRGADIIVCATTSSAPVFPGSALPAGTHVSGVGSFTHEMQEVDVDVVRRARVVVEDVESAMEEAGDLIIPMEAGDVPKDVIDCELGDIVNGAQPEGSAGRELTFFKSVGTAVQDVAVGAAVLQAAIEANVGTVVEV